MSKIDPIVWVREETARENIAVWRTKDGVFVESFLGHKQTGIIQIPHEMAQDLGSILGNFEANP